MIGVRVKLTFPEELVREPIIARMVKELDIVPNIRRADVGEHNGWIICELDGERRHRRPGRRVAAERGRAGRPAGRRRRELTGGLARPAGRSGGRARSPSGPTPPDRPGCGWIRPGSELLAANQRNWDERVSIHLASRFYDVERWLVDPPRATPPRARGPG